MSSHHDQAPFFIKIKYDSATHKFQVNQPVPIWLNFSAAIAQRFGISEEKRIGLRYILDREGDTITISTQADCDELWHKVLSVAATSSQTGCVDQRAHILELALINCHSSQAQPSPAFKSDVEDHIIHFWKDLPAAKLGGEGEGQYLDLKNSYVLGNPELGHRFFVRAVYKELHEHFDRHEHRGCKTAKSKWIVTGTPGVGKTFFAAYYMWVAACQKKNVVWEPFEDSQKDRSTYLMTSDGVERVNYGSRQLVKAFQDSETVYIVDGQPPLLRPVWTLLVTSPQYRNYKNLLKQSKSDLLYMPPWSQKELQLCKEILYPGEKELPTTLMGQLFEWYGGVPRYVLEIPSTEFKFSDRNEKDVVRKLVANLKYAIGKVSLTGLIKAHQARNRDGEFSHCVLHLCRHPSGSLDRIHLAWASPSVEREVVEQFSKEIRTDMKHFLRSSNDASPSNLRGLIFETYAHIMLEDGGIFQARRLCKGDPTSNQNVEVEFLPAKV
ncbi:hypothetical protein PTTG_12180 [Puccinia triticina 1-1 BBBD Race 1]|uniref:PB1 domain-containing protein n=1 Tax=Puccinia triticina (isolate 1-1 / race 1 (BBBD)) TaxID=630390 RepID=A0A180H345_PUCT1|nr:hypothetical protein PTTG_12180 [Puccinia triticina 1-1 BBBD Race 1]